MTTTKTPATKKSSKPAPKTPASKTDVAETKPTTKVSALTAAARVLTESGEPMSCSQLIGAMAAKGYWTSPGGKTPAQTLYAAILREITTKKEGSRFRKTGRGHFAIATHV